MSIVEILHEAEFDQEYMKLVRANRMPYEFRPIVPLRALCTRTALIGVITQGRTYLIVALYQDPYLHRSDNRVAVRVVYRDGEVDYITCKAECFDLGEEL